MARHSKLLDSREINTIRNCAIQGNTHPAFASLARRYTYSMLHSRKQGRAHSQLSCLAEDPAADMSS